MTAQLFDLAGALCILLGAVLCLVAAIALYRFPDLLCKMHSITKPQVLGVLLISTGVFLSMRTWWIFWLCTLIVALQLVTAPVSATLVARSAYRVGMVEDDIMVMDDLAEDLAGAGFQLAERGVADRSQPPSPLAEQADVELEGLEEDQDWLEKPGFE